MNYLIFRNASEVGSRAIYHLLVYLLY